MKERLERERANTGTVHVVPPLVRLRPPQTARAGVLVNLGGLQNPFWPLAQVQVYALHVATAIRSVVPVSEAITLTTSTGVAVFLSGKLANTHVTSLPHNEIQDVMAGYRIAFMTPGLGNIYDASAHALPTIWLPPANDSQGRQLTLLNTHGHADAAIDWSALGHAVNYEDPQPVVLQNLANAITGLSTTAGQHALTGALQQAWQQVNGMPQAKIAGLVKIFGHNGASAVASALLQTYGKTS